jgi:outer membrane cobalamin receptor
MSTAPLAACGGAMWRFLLSDLRRVAWSAMGVPGRAARFPAEARARPIRAPFLIAVMLLFMAPGLMAQSNTKLKGRVFDDDEGTPVRGAQVTVVNSGYHTLTDVSGRFSFDDLPPGRYSVTISADGYEIFTENDVEIAFDVTMQMDVRLSKKMYYLGKIIVEEKPMSVASDRIEVLSRERIEQSGARNIPELLESVAGVYVQESGASSGGSQVRIRGSLPEHVLVLVDGQKINPSGSGTADLSTIPIEMVEQIEIYKGGASARYGPDALAGAINIVTHRKGPSAHFSTEAERAWGRWKGELYGLSLIDVIPVDRFSSKLSYSRRRSVGDYDFAYRNEPSAVRDTLISGTRINNASDAYNYFTSGSYRFNGKLRLFFTGQYYSSRRGLPGAALNQNRSAASSDRRRLLNTHFQYAGSISHDFKLELGFSRFEQHFADRESYVKYDGRYTNDVFTIRHSQRHLVLPQNRLDFGMELRRDILYHSDAVRPQFSMGKTVRDDFGLFLTDEHRIDLSGLVIADDISFDAAFRYDYTTTSKDSTSWEDTVRTNNVEYISPKVGVVISKGDRLRYALRANYGRSLRLPSINALFWKGDTRAKGNPGLKPEKSEHSEAGFEVGARVGPVSLSGGMTYFHSYIRDLVVWTPSAGVWKPVNLERSRITGHEDYVEIALFDKKVSLSYQNTITTAVNRSPNHTIHNKRLVFSPHYITTITTRVDYKFLSASYSARLVDSAYTLPANTKYYSSYRVDDLRVGLDFIIADVWHLAIDYKLYNVRDESYLLMADYPMPGREWNVGFKVTYGLNE